MTDSIIMFRCAGTLRLLTVSCSLSLASRIVYFSSSAFAPAPRVFYFRRDSRCVCVLCAGRRCCCICPVLVHPYNECSTALRVAGPAVGGRPARRTEESHPPRAAGSGRSTCAHVKKSFSIFFFFSCVCSTSCVCACSSHTHDIYIYT